MMKEEESARRIIDYLNQQAGKNFKYSHASLDPILAIFKHGILEDDCKRIIDNKIADTDFDRKYLQPSTLFRVSKAENYLNQTVRGKPEADNQTPKASTVHQALIVQNDQIAKALLKDKKIEKNSGTSQDGPLLLEPEI